MVKTKSTLASIVTVNKPKRLIGLGQKGMQSGLGPVLWPKREPRTAGVKSGPKSSIGTDVEHGNAARSPGSHRADLTARRVRSCSIGMTEEANASSNVLDMPTSVWSEMARA